MNSQMQNLISKEILPGKLRFISIGGGSINQTFRIETDTRNYFCKINSAKKFPGLFEKEKNGLAFLRPTNCITVPNVIWCGEKLDKQVLVMEWVDQGMKSNSFWKKFGEQLASLHQWPGEDDKWSDQDSRATRSANGQRTNKFGFHEDNFMGALPQINSFKENWIAFFVECRLMPQLKLATDKGLLGRNETELFESLCKKLDHMFSPEPASALHGDLWSGNYLCDKSEMPVLIDPAVYYGHRCVDLGMTRLFGGFDNAFYQAYHYHYPLPKNFDEQVDVCNLYPLLIHLNLFGSGYLSSISGILKQYG